MKKIVSLRDFYQTIYPDPSDFPTWEAYVSEVCLSRGPHDLLILHVHTNDSKFSWQSVIRTERCLENALKYPDLALKIDFGPQALLAALKDISGLEAWIKRHAISCSTIEQDLFCQGGIESLTGNRIIWKMPSQAYGILLEQKCTWADDFWLALGMADIDFRIVAGEDQDNSKPSVAEEMINLQAKFASKHVAPPPKKERKENINSDKKDPDNLIWGRKKVPETNLIKLADLDDRTFYGRFQGQVRDLEYKEARFDSYMVKFLLVEGHSALRCMFYVKSKEIDQVKAALRDAYIEVYGDVEWNETFERDFQCRPKSIFAADPKDTQRVDHSKDKRVELHLHTKFSAKDASSSASDLVKAAATFGHPAIAITDHGVVQAFPEAQAMRDKLAAAGTDIKLIFGLEGYLVDDGPTVFLSPEKSFARDCKSITSLVLDLEDTNNPLEEPRLRGLMAKRYDFNNAQLENPQELTIKLVDENDLSYQFDLKGEKREVYSFKDSLKGLSKFLNNTALVSRGGLSDLHTLRDYGFQVGEHEPRIKFNPAYLDLYLLTSQADFLSLDLNESGQKLLKELRRGQGSIHEELKNQDHEVLITDEDWLSLWPQIIAKYCQDHQLLTWDDLNSHCGHKDFESLRRERARTNHIVILANNNLGLYHLYRLVSLSHLDEFHYRPRIPKSKLKYFRSGLQLGAACISGEVYSKIWQTFKALGSDYELVKSEFTKPEWAELAKAYDYLEIQPLANNEFLLTKEDSGVVSRDDLIKLNKLVVDLGDYYKRPVCATCDVHFLEPEDAIYREILLTNMGFEDAGGEEPAPLYLRTTDEMLKEFSYLGEEKAVEVVVTNTQMIADKVDQGMRPFPSGSYPPVVENSDENLRKVAYDNALARYGKEGKLPQDIEDRLEQELSSVIDNGYAVMYDIAHKMVKKSNEDGYIVGSRGSVGSSVLANFCGISEVNPLAAHYICDKCHYYEVDTSGNYGSGFDLPAKPCPDCANMLTRDGQDIPFATFLGFTGNKQPDIDLNFSGIYQSESHAYLEEMFGQGYTFRAGTVSSYGDKTAYGEVLGYCENHNLVLGANNVRCLAQGLEGIKTSTGQHPGGIIVIPQDWEIYDFTPIQYPANKKDSPVITTHFDFRSLEDTILKIDALGHDDPTMLKYLSDTTGVDVLDIPIPDERVMHLFQSTEAIGIDPEESTIGSATIGLPEVGTLLARDMIQETKPTRFYDLVQLSGLSHGTGVWKGNAQDLIRNGTCTINEVIGCRDSIMNTLIYAGLDTEMSFNIMETVRKGRALNQEQIDAMVENNVPGWYIDSCKKIQYLFPKAHAAAYSISTQRVAYFKVYYPEAFYSVWFTVKGGSNFNNEEHLLPPEAIKARRLAQRKEFARLSTLDQKKFIILELVEEMQARNIHFLPIDLEKSHAEHFYSPEKGYIRPPLDIINGISTSMAYQITQARDEGGSFENIDEIRQRTGLGEAAIGYLRQAGVLDGLPESSQISLFDYDVGLIG